MLLHADHGRASVEERRRLPAVSPYHLQQTWHWLIAIRPETSLFAAMALRITEFFGYPPLDPAAAPFVSAVACPFVSSNCIKPRHGACSVMPLELGEPVICCPNRMYGENFLALEEIAKDVFGSDCVLVKPIEANARKLGVGDALTGKEVVVFGKYWGNELPLPRPKGVKANKTSAYYVDWILAKLSASGDLEEIIAVEVQTIDTTGNYSDQAKQYFKGEAYARNSARNPGYSEAGMNWENVNKRILPQLIYKGHVLRREEKCLKGLYFVCPKQVYDRIRDRLGGDMHAYRPQPGSITFRSYELGPEGAPGTHRSMTLHGQFTTTVDQVALAFTSPKNLPDQDVYAAAIKKALGY
jgi:Restriction endonuclease NotI